MSAPTGDLFAAGGDTGRLMARLDWSGTPLGAVEGWSQSLRAAVRMVLSSRYPMLLLWGDRFTQLYNDAYSALIGDKHPAALGDDVRVTLAEGWDVLRPLIEEAMATGVASWVPALRLLLDRAGYREEAYFSVSHAPARDDDGRTVGILTVCSEVTEQVVGERRLRLLRDLSVHGGGQTVDTGATCAGLVEAIAGHPLDVPFAAIYLREDGRLRRVAHAGAAVVGATLPAVVEAAGDTGGWGLSAAASGTTTEVTDVATRMPLPAGAFDDPVRVALALPLPSAELDQPLGVLLVGVSPSRGLDEAYRSFFQLLAQQVSVAVRNARAYEEERRRAEALAELDRVKTTFFTNVSHEFRTPLTLMLGPLGDALADTDEPLPPAQRERIDLARRNAGRLLTLVNSLLTFSTLEAGQARAVPREVDLAAVTGEFASVFRAAVERAGLRLVVRCPPLPRPVAVDPALWEQIVTNLLSNALKYTFVGRIRVALEHDEREVRLTVSDTGIGISEADLPRLFERFHRVHGARSRSHEGTGIGLALVRELTRLQGGEVRVASATGVGTTFTIALPWTALTAPPAGPEPAGLGEVAQVAAQAAFGWLAGSTMDGPAPAGGPVPPGTGPEGDEPHEARILVADDNSDMRGYLARLLAAQGWRVRTVGDGRQALDEIRRNPPDLLLTDVMMPGLDGFALVRALRREEATRALPVVVLSARAGGEASVEGLDLGADDYVVKPFTAADLVARIRVLLRRAGLRTHPDEPATGPVPPTGESAPPAPRSVEIAPPAPPTVESAPPASPTGPGSTAVCAVAAGPRPTNGTVRPRSAAPEDGPPPPPTRPSAVPDVDLDWTYPSDPTAAQAMRRDLRVVLDRPEVDPDVVQDLLVAASEAVNNAVEHAQRPSRPEVRVRLKVDADTVRISVRDFGTWRDRRPAMDRGRGAMLMDAYAQVRMSSTDEGTTVVIERRLTDPVGGPPVD
ncbi:ATP-binding protein [Micromonospora psammae]|uniref:ATP-binding protein n=1 Tax=Micromonospora sp. CPCC 205556 TaxID=3122398 RepID=UPI002FF0A349